MSELGTIRNSLGFPRTLRTFMQQYFNNFNFIIFAYKYEYVYTIYHNYTISVLQSAPVAESQSL